jgi:hypothetical protein
MKVFMGTFKDNQLSIINIELMINIYVQIQRRIYYMFLTQYWCFFSS